MDLKTAVNLAKQYKLRAPDEFWELTLDELQDIVSKGGCGPGDFGDRLVPDTIYFLSIKPA